MPREPPVTIATREELLVMVFLPQVTNRCTNSSGNPERGKYRHVPCTSAVPHHRTHSGDQRREVSGWPRPGAAVLGSLATSRCIDLGLRAQRTVVGGRVHQRGRV